MGCIFFSDIREEEHNGEGTAGFDRNGNEKKGGKKRVEVREQYIE